jgi:mRNA-degrading endonuclease YafQ of YafQ-DinJ toxin-antitoxin module
MKHPIKTIYVTSHFERQYQKLPRSAQVAAEKKERVFRSDAFDPCLGTHKLKGKLRGLWAFSVTRDIRIIFEFLNGDEVLFHDIGPHSTVYEKSKT